MGYGFVEVDVFEYLEGLSWTKWWRKKKEKFWIVYFRILEVIGVVRLGKENEISIEEGRMSVLRWSWGWGVLGYFDLGKKEVDGIYVVVLCLLEGKEFEVSIYVWLL